MCLKLHHIPVGCYLSDSECECQIKQLLVVRYSNATTIITYCNLTWYGYIKYVSLLVELMVINGLMDTIAADRWRYCRYVTCNVKVLFRSGQHLPGPLVY